MIVSALLTMFMLASLGVGLVMRRRSPAVSLGLIVVSLAGIWFSWMPNQLTAVANALGVGRGADLALYLWVSISFLALAGLALQLRHVQRQLTLLAREFAISRALAGPEESAPAGARAMTEPPPGDAAGAPTADDAPMDGVR
jgi:hypothetical protein